jgi:hypothetical protein
VFGCHGRDECGSVGGFIKHTNGILGQGIVQQPCPVAIYARTVPIGLDTSREVFEVSLGRMVTLFPE